MESRFNFTFAALTMARYRVLAWLMLAFAIALSVAFIPSLQFESDVGRGYSSNNESRAALAKLHDELEVRAKQLVVMAETEDETFTRDQLVLLRNLSLDLLLIDGIATVTSPFALNFPPAAKGEPVRAVLDLDSDPLDSLDTFSRFYPGIPTLVSPDQRALVIFCAPENDLNEAGLRRLIAEVNALTSTSEYTAIQSLQFWVAGEDPLLFGISDALRDDLTKLIILGPIFALVLTILIMRSVRWSLIAFLPAIASTLFSLAAFPLLGIPITGTSVVVPILVLILALSDAIHLTWHFRDQLLRDNLPVALERSIGAIAPANALTSATTGIGFLAITASEFEPNDEMALIGTFSVIAAYWIVVAGVIVLAPLGTPARQIAASYFKIPNALALLPVNRPLFVLTITGLIFALFAGAALRIEPWFSVDQYLPEKAGIRQAHREIEDRFGGYFRLWFEVDRPDSDAQQTEDISAPPFDRLSAISDAIRSVRPDAMVVSAATYAPWSRDEGGASNGFLQELPSSVRAELGLDNPNLDRLLVLMPDPMFNTASREAHDALVAAALQAGADRAIGFPNILRHDALQVVYDLGIGLFVACTLATALVALAFLNGWLFFILLVPNAIPLVVATASLAWLNHGQINPTAVLALTIAFGAAVDDSIHLLNRYALRRQQGEPHEEAIRLAIRGAGRVMITTTLVVSASIASTFISQFELIRLFGSLFIVIFASALVADLLVLPALLRLGYKR